MARALSCHAQSPVSVFFAGQSKTPRGAGEEANTLPVIRHRQSKHQTCHVGCSSSRHNHSAARVNSTSEQQSPWTANRSFCRHATFWCCSLRLMHSRMWRTSMGATYLHHMPTRLVEACHRYQYTDSCLSVSPAATFALLT